MGKLVKGLLQASKPEYPARIAFCIGPVGEEIEFFHVKKYHI